MALASIDGDVDDLVQVPESQFKALLDHVERYDDEIRRQVDAELEKMRHDGVTHARPVHDPDTEWFKARRRYFLELSENTENKWPERVAYYCWATHHRDGHRPLADGELQRIMGKPDEDSKRVKDRWIKPAIRKGLLGPESEPMCLVAPPGTWFDYGPRTKWCEHHRAGVFAPVSRECFGSTRR